MSETYFTKIDTPKMNEVIDFLIHNGTELVIKIKNQHYKSRILNRRTLTLFSIYKFSLINFENEDVVCSFEISEDKYFFKSQLTSRGDDFKILIPIDIFQLQRRNDFRINVPSGMTASCEVKTINMYKAAMKVELRNLSLGGCMIAFPTRQLKISLKDEVDIKIQLHQFDEEKIPTIAKHIKMIDSSQKTLVGLQFVAMDAAFLTELQGLLFFLDRVHRGKGYD
jgi:c-di-GMP-binding flagellar brake protein YcgR